MKYVYCFWLFLLIKSSNCSDSSDSDNVSERRMFGKKLGLVKMKAKTQILTHTYCKSVYTAEEAEELLNYGERNIIILKMYPTITVLVFMILYFVESKHVKPPGEWWKRYNAFGKNVPNPMCSAYPNALLRKRTSIARMPISRNQFFQSLGIDIPVRPGHMSIHPIEFRYFKRNPVWKLFLECDCNITENNQLENGNVCFDGIIHLSRGVCGDKSFFVYMPSSSLNFNVVAHISY